MSIPARQIIVPALAVVSLAVVALAVAGCSKPFGGSDEPSRFYVLTAEPAQPSSRASSSAQQGPIVGVSQVELADHLKREAIVTRSTGNRVVLADLDNWAAELQDNISSVLAQNLSNMIPSERVVLLPSSRTIPLDFRVQVEIPTFEQGPDGAVELIAVWQVFKGDDYGLLSMRKSTITQPVEGEGYDAIVAAMSNALGDLSRQITAEIR